MYGSRERVRYKLRLPLMSILREVRCSQRRDFIELRSHHVVPGTLRYQTIPLWQHHPTSSCSIVKGKRRLQVTCSVSSHTRLPRCAPEPILASLPVQGRVGPALASNVWVVCKNGCKRSSAEGKKPVRATYTISHLERHMLRLLVSGRLQRSVQQN